MQTGIESSPSATGEQCTTPHLDEAVVVTDLDDVLQDPSYTKEGEDIDSMSCFESQITGADIRMQQNVCVEEQRWNRKLNHEEYDEPHLKIKQGTTLVQQINTIPYLKVRKQCYSSSMPDHHCTDSKSKCARWQC
ncbi:unnamed protein product [Pleuronectes platessa]|uniref:Uncharacterized protein n=1 Tax=Pleuronectes platessa TaxID=8262 RepID=A0A9N7YPA1_PLEPL|nr:unnamed protein product [Pleuronectes platessa]